MNLQDLKSIEQSLIGDGYSLIERASKLRDAIVPEAESGFEKLDALTPLLAAWCSNVSTINIDEAQAIHNLFRSLNTNQISITTSELKSIVISREVTHDDFATYESVSCDGEQYFATLNRGGSTVLMLSRLNVHKPTEYSDGSEIEITIPELIENLSNGVSMPEVFGRICQCIVDSVNASNESLTTQVTAIIGSRCERNPEIFSSLIAAASAGQNVLLHAITNIYNKANVLFQKAADEGEADLANTSFEVQAFSWGIVGALAITVAQIATQALAAIGGVIGVISAIISGALGVIKNVVTNVAGAATGTAFISTGYKGSPCFNVVLNEFDVESETIADILTDLETVTFTINSDSYPCVIQGILLDNGKIRFQELPSINFSFINQLIPISGNNDGFWVNANRYIKICDLSIDHYHPELTSPGFIFRKSMMTAANLTLLVRGCHEPVDISVATYLDSLKDFTESDMLSQNANIWMERLLTSIILWLMLRNYSLIDALCIAMQCDGVYFPVHEEAWQYNTLLGKQFQLFRRLTNYYALALHTSGSYDGSINMRSQQDDLIQTIGKYFNKLAWREDYQSSVYEDLYYGSANTGDLTLDSVEEVGTTQLANIYYPWLYQSALLDEPTIPWSTILGTSNKFIISGLVQECAVSVPHALISGVILGIIADVIILALVAVATAITVKFALKVKNRIRRKQAEVEAKWYAYQDTLTDGSTKAQQDAAWNDYKKSRLKYNISAFFTGGTTLGLGLYDEGSTGSDSVSPILNSIKGSSSSAHSGDMSLSTLLNVITGN